MRVIYRVKLTEVSVVDVEAPNEQVARLKAIDGYGRSVYLSRIDKQAEIIEIVNDGLEEPNV